MGMYHPLGRGYKFVTLDILKNNIIHPTGDPEFPPFGVRALEVPVELPTNFRGESHLPLLAVTQH